MGVPHDRAPQAPSMRFSPIRPRARFIRPSHGCTAMTRCKIEMDERQLSRQLAERRADLLQLAPEERAAFLKAARSDWLLAMCLHIVHHALHRRILTQDRGSAGLVGIVGAQV